MKEEQEAAADTGSRAQAAPGAGGPGLQEDPGNIPGSADGYFRMLIDKTMDMITVLDREGRVVFNSGALSEILEYEPDELNGMHAFELVHPDDIAMLADIFARGVQVPGAVGSGTYRFRDKKGSWRWLESVFNNLLEDPRVRGIVVSSRDITERRRMEEELRDRNEELEAFAQTISHDLLTPVSIVEGYAKAALEADAEGRAEAERECLEAIARGARRMSDLINSLLQYAQAGHMEPQSYSVDPEEVLLEVLLDMDEEVVRKRAKVEAGAGLPRIRADAVKLRQVFSNLIGNALKHMGDSPEPRVLINVEERDSTAVFCVRDNGIGIPPDLQQKVFEPFRRFSLSEAPGLGIGLSTVKRAVKTWGGRVWLESNPGEGAAFFFTAPLDD